MAKQKEKITKEEKKQQKAERKEEKKAKKKLKIKNPLSPKQLAIAMAIIALVSFGYKFTVGMLAMSLVMIIAAIPTFFVFLCKFLYAKHMDEPREKKKRAYLLMLIFTASFALLFILFSTLKVGGIDISIENKFDGWIGIVFIFFIIAMFVLSIINLKGALNKSDLVVIGIKEISFVSALTDAVMINEFLYRVIVRHILDTIQTIDILHAVDLYTFLNNLFPLAVGVIMAVVPFVMLRRYLKYQV